MRRAWIAGLLLVLLAACSNPAPDQRVVAIFLDSTDWLTEYHFARHDGLWMLTSIKDLSL